MAGLDNETENRVRKCLDDLIAKESAKLTSINYCWVLLPWVSMSTEEETLRNLYNDGRWKLYGKEDYKAADIFLDTEKYVGEHETQIRPEIKREVLSRAYHNLGILYCKYHKPGRDDYLAMASEWFKRSLKERQRLEEYKKLISKKLGLGEQEPRKSRNGSGFDSCDLFLLTGTF